MFRKISHIHRLGLILGKNASVGKRDTRFGTWNVKSLYRAGFLTSAAKGLVRFRLDLMGVELVRWEKRDTVLA